MKKYLFSIAFASLLCTKAEACVWSDPDHDYFNLFTQSIIKDKSYLPFLHNYSERFYRNYTPSQIVDENIEAWRKYFGNQITYSETNFLVNKISLADLNALKKGISNIEFLKKLGPAFYTKYYEGVDYLIEAKYLEPYMRIKYIESPDSFYYRENEADKNASQLHYNTTISSLTSLYNAAKNPEIKQRYGYQLVRFNHYTRNFQAALDAFKKYVQPISLKGAAYYMATDQLAGAQRGLQMGNEANWNFFQVFMKSKSRKESAFISMKLSDSASFNNILQRAATNEEKNMAYFLLGYEDFTNPIPMMEKMYAIDPDSEILKVMAARSINELERNYLPTYYYASENASKDSDKKNTAAARQTEVQEKKLSFWQKTVLFFKNLFGGEKSSDTTAGNAEQNDDELFNNPDRIPTYVKNNANYYVQNKNQKDFLDDLEKFAAKTKEKSNDAYWQIADAYLKFLKKEYKESSAVLAEIKTSNPEYLQEINRMKVLNDIVSQPKIDAEYEDYLIKKYAEYFVEKVSTEKDSTDTNAYDDYGAAPSTADFLKDVLANRYFLQGEDGKSFLMNNKLSDLQYNPNSSLVKSVEEFYRKPNKTQFEQQIIAKNLDSVGNIEAFFANMYGDRAIRLADFAKAKSWYQKAQGFSGIPRGDYKKYNPETGSYEKMVYDGFAYDGYNNIPNLVFGHNIWESFQSSDAQSMKAENYTAFPFIKNKMNKLELADALVQLKNIGNGKGAKAAQANQLIGNVLYNTSILGYYRHIFVMDVDNSNGGKYNFWNTNTEKPYQYYYKNFTQTSCIEPDNFDLAINYYKKALNSSTEREQQARILFQMASAEQGKYYQYEAKNQARIDYSDPKWSEKNDAYQTQMRDLKNQKYRTYFTRLKYQFSDTETARQLLGSCTYFDYFMKR